MLPPGALLTLLLSAAPLAGGDRVALAPLPLQALERSSRGVLAPPPEIVVRKAERYGDVTIDHRKHLSLRAPCVRCHGPGPVSKIVLGPKLAHERCVGCHKEVASGPTNCAGCHVKVGSGAVALPTEEPAPAAPAPPPEPVRPPPSPAAEAAAAAPAGAGPGREGTPPQEPAAGEEAPTPRRFVGGRAVLELEPVVVGEAAEPAPTPEPDAAALPAAPREPVAPSPPVASPEPTEVPLPPPEPAPVAAAQPAPAAPSTEPPPGVPASTPPAGATLAAAPPIAAAAAPGPAQATVPETASAGSTARAPSRQLVQLGLAAGTGVGPSLRIASRADRVETAYVLERLSTASGARILMAYDFGATWPIEGRWTAWAVGAAGFDAQESPSLGFAPTLGARAGIEWAPPPGWFIRSVHLSVSGLATIAPAGGVGASSSGARFFVTLATGLPIPGASPRP